MQDAPLDLGTEARYLINYSKILHFKFNHITSSPFPVLSFPNNGKWGKSCLYGTIATECYDVFGVIVESHALDRHSIHPDPRLLKDVRSSKVAAL